MLRLALAYEELRAHTLLVSGGHSLTMGGHLSVSRAQSMLTDFVALPIDRWASAPASRLRAPGLLRDAAYVALAEAPQCLPH